MEIQEKVIEMLCNQMGLKSENINVIDNLMQDLLCDSIDLIDISLEIEEEFGIEIPDAELESLFTKTTTVNELVEYVKQRVNSENEN